MTTKQMAYQTKEGLVFSFDFFLSFLFYSFFLFKFSANICDGSIFLSLGVSGLSFQSDESSPARRLRPAENFAFDALFQRVALSDFEKGSVVL